MASTPTTLPNLQPVGHGTYRTAVNRQILALILRGQFPAGQRLILNDLAQELELSITPVREAMLDLAALGMVEFRPNRGAVARAFGAPQLADLYDFRRILEVEATRKACQRIPTDALRDILAKLETLANYAELPTDQALEVDHQLHDLIAQHCGSQRLHEEIKRYDLLMQAVHDVIGNHDHIQSRANEEHLVIVHALLEHDGQRATRAMADHLERTSRDVSNILWPVLR